MSLPAQAAELDIENFHPASPGDARFFGVGSARLAAPNELAVGLWFHFADDSLVAKMGSETVAEVVKQRFVGDLAVAYRLVEWMELGAGLPIIFGQSSDVSLPMTETEGGGTGDARLFGRVHLFGGDGDGLAGAGTLAIGLPTTSGSDLSGDGMVSALPQLALQMRQGRITAAANVGARLRESEQIGDMDIGSAFTYGVGVAVVPGPAAFALIAELQGAVAGASGGEAPVEARGGARLRLPMSLELAAGYGRGLNDGFGAPDHRVVVSLGYRPEQASPFVVAKVVPPEDPDPDKDGLTDTDKCPTVAEDFDGWQDDDGCPEADNDGDGIVDRDDKCPLHAEDKDGFRDEDGCPDPDNDLDGIVDTADKCPLEPEVINGNEDDDGCPDQGKQLVVIGKDAIEIKEKMFFATDKDIILPQSEPLLEQLAKNLARNTWIKKVRIEGHTDDQGPDQYNQDLSQRRVESVRKALIQRGISEERLTAVGYGESQPIDSNSTVDGRANNRRVAFTILAQDGERPPPQTQPAGQPAPGGAQ